MNKPYVYIIQNKDRTHWYVGMRSANRCPAIEDTKYWGSSKYLKALIKKTGKENWTKTIIAEFDTPTEAHEYEQHLIKSMWNLPGRVNKGMSGFIDHSDPEVKAKTKAAVTIANKKKAQDPVWQANNKAANQKKHQDPVYRANHKAAMEELWQDPEFRAKQLAAMEEVHQDPTWQANHKTANQRKAQDPVYRANHKAGIRKKLAKPFIATNIATGEEFYCESSRCEQAQALGLNSNGVSNFLRGKYKQHNGYTFRYV